jgi:hypothetical protein
MTKLLHIFAFNFTVPRFMNGTESDTRTNKSGRRMKAGFCLRRFKNSFIFFVLMDGYIRTETDVRGNNRVGWMIFDGRSGYPNRMIDT